MTYNETIFEQEKRMGQFIKLLVCDSVYHCYAEYTQLVITLVDISNAFPVAVSEMEGFRILWINANFLAFYSMSKDLETPVMAQAESLPSSSLLRSILAT